MDPWLGFGIFLLGTGIGALLTHIATHDRRKHRVALEFHHARPPSRTRGLD